MKEKKDGKATARPFSREERESKLAASAPTDSAAVAAASGGARDAATKTSKAIASGCAKGNAAVDARPCRRRRRHVGLQPLQLRTEEQSCSSQETSSSVSLR